MCQYVDRSEPKDIYTILKGTQTNKRLLNFKINGTVCEACGLEGQYFRAERSKYKPSDKVPNKHLNLYGVDKKGKEVLMTRDHILPLSLGGPDEISNERTLCQRCNSKRGNPLEFPLISACPI